MADKKEEDEDPRFTFLGSWTRKSLGLKADLWPKMIGNDENMVRHFLNFFC